MKKRLFISLICLSFISINIGFAEEISQVSDLKLNEKNLSNQSQSLLRSAGKIEHNKITIPVFQPLNEVDLLNSESDPFRQFKKIISK